MSDATADLSSIAGLKDSLGALSSEEVELARMLVTAGQQHLFSDWAASPADDDAKHAFFAQVRNLNENYPGGVQGYVDNARKLLQSSKEGVNPFEGFTPEVPTGVNLKFGDEECAEVERLGMAAMKDTVFVLVAGGLGERLGYSGIKVSLPVELTTGTCYLQLYASYILNFQRLAGGDVKIPLAIMTSDDTHARTMELLQSHSYFGLEESQVHVMKQEKVAALTDNDARIARSESSPYEIETKPHGHGDVHLLLRMTGLAHKWAKEGRQWICFFQDTNSLAFRSIPAAVGVSIKLRLHMNSMTIPRRAKDAVGAIVRLSRADGTAMTCNVEYNQLDPVLRATVNPEGDVADPSTGFSPYPGNTNQLVMHLPSYADTLDATGGLMPEFVNPKYKDASKTTFKKPTRLECMMQDYPRALGTEERVGFTSMDAWISYSPVKNSLEEAAAKAKSGNLPASASAGEMEYYEANAHLLRLVGATVAPAADVEVAGVPLREGPRVVLAPSFAASQDELRGKLPSPGAVVVQGKSTLVLDGPDIVVKSLNLNGALIVQAVPGAKLVIDGLTVSNEGYSTEPLTEEEMAGAAPEVLRIRGFRLKRNGALVVQLTTPGEYVLNDETAAALGRVEA